jgi:hypothetical protein
LTVLKSQHVFQIDLNSVRGDQVGALLTFAADPVAAQIYSPSVGDLVQVVDPEEGDLYEARVDVIDGIWLGVTIRWDTQIPSVKVKPFGHSSFNIATERVPTEVPTAA